MASMTTTALAATSLGASQLQTLQSRRDIASLALQGRLQYSQSQHQQQRQTPVGRRRSKMQQVNASTADRVARLGRAYVNSWANRTVGEQENPELMMGTLLQDMTRDVQKLRTVYSQVAASRLQLQKQAAETQKAVRIWTDRAEAAVHADKDDLARYALRQRTNAKDQLKRQQPQLAQLDAACDALRANLVTMQDKAATARLQAPTLKARYAAAKASQTIADSLGSFQSGTDNAFAALNKMEDKIDELEFEANSFFPQELSADHALDARFSRLLEDDLVASMRRQLPG